MSLDSDYWQRWIAPLLAFLAADASDQLAWADKHQVRTAAVAEEVEFSLHLAKGMADRGTFEPEALQDLKAIGRLVGEADGCGHVGRWADALATDATWGEVRTLARGILVARLGTWHQPLPRRVLPQQVYD
ncbi:hypothetical protein OG936_14450 [Streptomyces sp. NBC_00846]|uniref:hypothetical protein n=1 Tax=Streptomyces sp. NBC_00846 TaxID=2975849 RepID=UPI00386BCD46|nr:hypothetical protein OG936_14450 [Streptomyces sp. NBC_00846]